MNDDLLQSFPQPRDIRSLILGFTRCLDDDRSGRVTDHPDQQVFRDPSVTEVCMTIAVTVERVTRVVPVHQRNAPGVLGDPLDRFGQIRPGRPRMTGVEAHTDVEVAGCPGPSRTGSPC